MSKTANLAFERSLVGLEESVAARAAQAGFGVEVLASWAAFLAVTGRASSGSDCHSWATRNVRTLGALSLTGLRLVSSAWARAASLVRGFVEGSDGAWHAIGDHRHLSGGASVFRGQHERSWVGHGVRQNVFDVELVIFQNELLEQILDGGPFSIR